MDARERALVGYATYAHALNHTYLLVIPLFLALWIQEFETDLYLMGLVAAAAYALYGGGALPFGHLADRLGSKPLVTAYLAGAAVSLVLVSRAATLAELTLGLALLGLSCSPYHPAATAMITREVREQGRGLGYHGMGGSLGIALGPLTASLLLLAVDWRTVLLLFALPAALGVLAFSLWGPVERAPRGAVTVGEVGRSLLSPGFALVFLIYVFAGIAYWGALTFLPAYLDTLALPALRLSDRAWTPGMYLFPALLAMGAAGQVVGGRLADRPRPEATVGYASLLVAGALVLLLLPVDVGVAAAALLFGFLLFALEPLQNVLVSRRVPGNLRGLAYGLVFLSVFGVGSVGAALGGFVGRTAGLAPAFLVLAPFMAASALMAFLLARRSPPGASA